MQYRGVKDVLDFFTSRERVFNFFDNRHLLDWMDDERYLKLAFKAKMGYPLDLDRPRTFNQKLQWLKLHDRNPLYTTRVDKYAVRQYIAEKIGAEYLIPLVGGPWKSAEEIDFDALPEQFVLKCNHDSGGLVVCRDKSRLDQQAAKQKLNRHLQANYYMSSREWPYKEVKPCIFAEQYMEDDRQKDGLIDYKFFCFNGQARFMYVSQGLEDHATAHISFYDLEGNDLPFKRTDFAAFDKLPHKPEGLGKMIQQANVLAQAVDSPFLRVDMYEIGGRIYFSELTFTPCSGMLPFDPPKWDETIGGWLMLPEKE